MFVTESFKGLAGAFQTGQLRDLPAFALPNMQAAVLHMHANSQVKKYADGLDLERLRVHPYFTMNPHGSHLVLPLSADGTTNEVSRILQPILPNNEGRFALIQDIAIKKDIASALLGGPVCKATLFIHKAHAPDPAPPTADAPHARAGSVWRGTPVHLGTPQATPDLFDLYAHKGQNPHVPAENADGWRFGVLFDAAPGPRQKFSTLVPPNPMAVAQKLREVDKKWGLSYKPPGARIGA